MKTQLELIFAQLLTPLFRLSFAFFFVPFHDEGDRILAVFISAELIAAIAVFGRNTLILTGFSHSYINRFMDLILIAGVTTICMDQFITEQQAELLYPIIVTSVGLWYMTMFSAYFLKKGRYFLYIAVVLTSYIFAILSLHAGITVAVCFILLYLIAELLMPRADFRSKKRFHCGVASLLSLFSQKADMQIALLFFGASISSDIFKLNALFLPLAILVRLFSNTALITGGTIIKPGVFYIPSCFILSLLYSAAVFFASVVFAIDILNNIGAFLIITLSVFLVFLNISNREKIAKFASGGEFLPLLILSAIGVIPFIYLLTMKMIGYRFSVNVFLFVAYLFPRLLMYIYGTYFSKRLAGEKID